MTTAEEVKKLAGLARIRIADAELETKVAQSDSSGTSEAVLRKFTSEFDAILAYVGQLESLQLPASNVQPPALLRNVMRDDGEPRMKSDFKRGKPHLANDYTPALIEEFPQKKGDALSVKQIISHD